jgi:hypothetical protein
VYFLVIDPRFGVPIHVFLETDPRRAAAFPGLAVREVRIEPAPSAERDARATIGQDPRQLARFREFRSDRAATGAGFIPVEPRYVGPTWESYSHEFRPQGEKPQKRPGRSGSAVGS